MNVSTLLLITSIISSLFPFSAVAQEAVLDPAAGQPGVLAFLSHRVKQTKVTDCTAAAQAVRWQNTVIKYSDLGLSVEGSSSHGKSWKTLIPANGVRTCEVWSTNMRKPSQSELVFVNYGYNVEGYDTELTILFIGDDGLPVPWQSTGRVVSTDTGIANLINASANGGSIGIVLPTRIGDRFGGYAYVTQLYNIGDVGLKKAVGSEAGVTWPAISGNTNLLIGNEKLDTLQLAFDLGVSTSRTASARLSKVEPPKVETQLASQAASQPVQDTSTLRVAPPPVSKGKLRLGAAEPTRNPQIVVTDSSAEGRTIYFDQNVPDGIEQLIRKQYPTKSISQSCDQELCGPFILWGVSN